MCGLFNRTSLYTAQEVQEMADQVKSSVGDLKRSVQGPDLWDGLSDVNMIWSDDVSRYLISQKWYFMVFYCLPLYSEYLEYHLYYKQFKARDFWEAQLSGDAPQRVAGSPKLRSFPYPEVENDLQVTKTSVEHCVSHGGMDLYKYVWIYIYIYMDYDVQCLYLEFFRFGQIMYHKICFLGLISHCLHVYSQACTIFLY